MKKLNSRSLRVACDALASREPAFAHVVAKFGYPPLWARPAGYETLVRIILEQQVSLGSARAVFDRLEALTGGVTPANVLRTGRDALRGAGLTRQKARYCHELAERVSDGSTSFDRIGRSSEASARRQLLEITGVGAWSADVYLLFACRCPDVWPPGDVALMRSVTEVFGLDAVLPSDQCAERARAWEPWRSAAARLLWHAYLSRRGRVHETA